MYNIKCNYNINCKLNHFFYFEKNNYSFKVLTVTEPLNAMKKRLDLGV